MKKYIILAGVPRARKKYSFTNSCKNIGYQHISMDSIIAGIEKVFPETDIIRRHLLSRKEIWNISVQKSLHLLGQ